MKKRYLSIVLLLLLGQTTKLSAQNLVQNWSAESFDASNHPNNWTAFGGAWQSMLHQSSYADPAEDGDYFFYAAGGSPDTLEQDVDVSSLALVIDASNQYFSFYGYVQSYPQGASSDQSRIIVQCLDAAKASVLHTFDSDTISSLGVWEKVLNNFLAPANTRFVRIMLIATRRSGFANDGYFDAISLTAGNKTSVPIVSNLENCTLYPNPATDAVFVQHAKGRMLSVTDISGREICRAISGSDREQVSISALSNGLYFMTIQDPVTGQTKVIRFSKTAQ